MSIKKQYFKTKTHVKVTLVLPKEAAPEATEVAVVADFNGWNMHESKMARQKSGDFKFEISLLPGRNYQFRYLIDGVRWENDWAADAYASSGILGIENSVIVL